MEEGFEGVKFIVTVDTEGDNLWKRPRFVTTRNARFLPRFQALCERYGLKPTYFVNYEMARDGAFVELGLDVLRRNQGEIGLHIHAWNSPPAYALTSDDDRFQPYLVEYPEGVLREKVLYLTELLSSVFGGTIRSHRAGRWALSGTYVRALSEAGIVADCSVTPGVSWRASKGAPWGSGGTDYRGYPTTPYFLDFDEPRRQGASSIVEFPVTILPRKGPLWNAVDGFPGGRWARPLWLRPRPGRFDEMKTILEWAWARKLPYVQWMIHSSELMPGGSPNFPTEKSIEKLYEAMEGLFQTWASRTRGVTVGEAHDAWVGRGGDPGWG